MPGCKKGDLAIIRGASSFCNGHFVTCVERVGVTMAISVDGRPVKPADVWAVSGPWIEDRLKVARSNGVFGYPVLPDRVLFPIRGDQPGKEDSEIYKLRSDAIQSALTFALSHLPHIYQGNT